MQAYRSVGVYSGVEAADPRQLIQLLLDGAVGAVQAAGAHLARRDMPAKAQELSRAVKIVDALRASLDLERGGDVAANLERLYDYIERQLTLANARNDGELMVESIGLLAQVRDAWVTVVDQAPPAAVATQGAG